MKNWSKHVVRAVGALNLIYGVLGTALLLYDLLRYSFRIQNSVRFPYDRAFYELDTAINAVFLVALMLAGYWLLGLRRRGAVLSNFVYSLEIFYLLLSDVVTLATFTSASMKWRAIGNSMAGEEGNMGIALQVITCYPVIALIVLNLARRRMNRDGNWKLPQGAKPPGAEGSSLPSFRGV